MKLKAKNWIHAKFPSQILIEILDPSCTTATSESPGLGFYMVKKNEPSINTKLYSRPRLTPI